MHNFVTDSTGGLYGDRHCTEAKGCARSIALLLLVFSLLLVNHFGLLDFLFAGTSNLGS